MEFCRDDLVLEVVFGFGAAGPLASVREKFVVVALVVAAPAVALVAARAAGRPRLRIGREGAGQAGTGTGRGRQAGAPAVGRARQGSGAAWPGSLRPTLRHPIACQAERAPLHLYIARTALSCLEIMKNIQLKRVDK